MRTQDAEQEAVKELSTKVEDTLAAQKIVQEVAEKVQQTAHKRIADVVTRCLKAVFGEEEAYEFRINFSQKRGKTEAELVFVRDGMEVDPYDGSGGGVIDVAAFALRLACLMLSLPKRRKLLVLDEPFRFLSVDYRPQVRALLELLAKDMGIQILMVTHAPDLVCGKVIEL